MPVAVLGGDSGPVTVHSRRKPWPYDIVIQGTPMILRPQENGLLIGRKLQTLANIAPITYDYSSQPVYAERTYAFRRLMGGYGERTQRSPEPNRYYFALNADLSIGGMQMKGPLFHEFLPANTGPITCFIDAVDTLLTPPVDYPEDWPPMSTFAGAGRYMLKHASDNPGGWTVSKDFGADQQVVKAVRYWPAGSGMTDSLWVALKSGQLWRFDGTNWAMSAQSAFTITVLRDELWIADGLNTVRNCTADPMVAGNWNAQIIVGDKSQFITNMEVLDNTLYIFKTNGVFTLNPDTSVNDRFPSFRQQPLPRNGVNAHPWLSRLWFGYGDSFYWLDNEGNLTPTGPNLLVENNSEVAGEVLAFTGHASWFGYYALWNGGSNVASPTNNSYLIKHGTWMNPDEANTASYNFFEVPNGAIKKWTGKKILTLYVSDAYPGNSRLYAGFEDGSLEWCLLPRNSPNPAHPDSGCEFTDEESVVYWPKHHAMFQADQKAYRGFSVFGPRVGPQNYVTVEYRVTHAMQQFSEMPVADQSPWIQLGQTFVFSGQRFDFDTNVTGTAIEVRHTLSSTNERTPVLEGVGLHEQVRPALQLEYTWTVNARRHLARRDGVIDRRTPWQIRETCLQAAATVGAVEVVMPEEGLMTISIVDYSESLAAVTQRYGVDWDIAMKGVQFRTLTTYGTWDRVALYDWDAIGLYTWDDLLYL